MNERLAKFLPKRSDLKLSPVLAESSFSRYFAFSLLYFAQGVPAGLVFFAIPAWLTMNGVTPLAIGSYMAASLLPWSIKLVLAPFMDLFTIESMGRKRPWVLVGQIGLVLSFLSLSTVQDPLGQMSILMAMGFAINFFACFQDVATDSMAVDLIPLDEQARANGLMWGCRTIGVSVSLSAGTYMINHFGFSTGVLVPAAFTSLLILVPLYFLERRGERRLPWSKGEASIETQLLQSEGFLQILIHTFRATTRYSSLFLVVAMFLVGFGQGYIDTILPIFTINEIGWTNDEFSNLFATANIVSGLLGMVVAGALVDFFGKKKMMLLYTLAWLVCLAGFLFYRSTWFGSTAISIIIFASAIGVVFLQIAAYTVCMAHCWKRISATQFTLYMTISNLGMSAGSASAGIAKEYSDWYTTFTIPLIVLVVCLLMVGFLQIKRQLGAIEKLETKALAKVEIQL